jgi:hypothetical protein
LCFFTAEHAENAEKKGEEVGQDGKMDEIILNILFILSNPFFRSLRLVSLQ